MQPQSRHPLDEWFAAHQDLLGTQTDTLVLKWVAALNANGYAVGIEEAWEVWYSNHSSPPPDLVACVAHYGYSRLLIQGWKQLPIEIPADQADAWREWGFGATLDEFRGVWQAGVAGGFLKLAGRDPELMRNTIAEQLQEKLAELTKLTDKPLEEYTPHEFTEEEIDEGYHWWERDRLDQPFKSYEQLICFDYGLQKFRLFSMTEEDKELNLPNKALYEALQQIDLGKVLARLDAAEPKLRRILQHLTKHRYFDLDSDIAPDSFWWRHWKQSMTRKGR